MTIARAKLSALLGCALVVSSADEAEEHERLGNRTRGRAGPKKKDPDTETDTVLCLHKAHEPGAEKKKNKKKKRGPSPAGLRTPSPSSSMPTQPPPPPPPHNDPSPWSRRTKKMKPPRTRRGAYASKERAGQQPSPSRRAHVVPHEGKTGAGKRKREKVECHATHAAAAHCAPPVGAAAPQFATRTRTTASDGMVTTSPTRTPRRVASGTAPSPASASSTTSGLCAHPAPAAYL